MKRILSFVIVMLLLLSFTITAWADNSPKGELVYAEDFESGETDIKPTSDKTGSVKIKDENGNHYLHFDGNPENDYSLACFGPYVADFDLSVKIRQKIHNGSWSYCMVLFHIDWNVNAYRADFFEDHARLAYNNGVDDETVFGSHDDFGVLDDKWYEVQIFGRAGEYTVVLDGKVIDTFTSDERDEGNFGFCGWQTEFDVDDIKITEYVDGTAPAVDTLVDGIEPETDHREIIESKRETRKMKDAVIEALGAAGSASPLVRVLLYSSIAVAILSVLLIATILILAFVKKRRSNK